MPRVVFFHVQNLWNIWPTCSNPTSWPLHVVHSLSFSGVIYNRLLKIYGHSERPLNNIYSRLTVNCTLSRSCFGHMYCFLLLRRLRCQLQDATRGRRGNWRKNSFRKLSIKNGVSMRLWYLDLLEHYFSLRTALSHVCFLFFNKIAHYENCI